MFIKKISLKTEWNRVTFVNLTEQIESFIKEAGVKDGMLLVQSLHTTCSVFYEEMVHDLDGLGYDFLQHDLIRGLNKIFPKQLL